MPDDGFPDDVDHCDIFFQRQRIDLPDIGNADIDDVRDYVVRVRMAEDFLVLGVAIMLLDGDDRVVEGDDAEPIGQMGVLPEFGADSGLDRLAEKELLLRIQDVLVDFVDFVNSAWRRTCVTG